MNGNDYLILGYCVAVGLMLGYAALLWLERRGLSNKG